MSEIPSSYRLVEMDNPFKQWGDPFVRRLFEKMLTLKINGYGRKYPPGVMPFDISCWYACHYLVCEEREDLHPVMGFQRVTLERYGEHYAPFGPLSSCRQAGCPRHIGAMEALVARFENRPEKLSYTGGFTIDPDLRWNRALIEELSRLMIALHGLFHEEEGGGHEIVTAPTVRFRVDALLLPYGFFPLVETTPGSDEGFLSLPSYAGEKVRFMRAQKFNQAMEQLVGRYRSLWDGRLRLGSISHENVKGHLQAAV